MTHLKQSRESSFEGGEFLVDHLEDNNNMMEECSPSSPCSPLSRPRSSSSSTKFSSNTSMTSSNSSRPLKFLSSRKPNKSESRRLFEEEEEEEGGGILLNDLKLSPPRALMRPMLRPPNLNHELQTFGECDDLEGSITAAPTPFPTCRKRPASEERVGLPVPASHENAVSGITNRSTAMHLSPRISPNSFLTMDGRFVHSKNPFSSPMMTDDDALFAGGGAAAVPQATATAPSMPVTFSCDNNSSNNNKGVGNKICVLSPRHHHQHPQRGGPLFPSAAPAATSALGGFPKKFFFTGSPIHEDEIMEEPSSSFSSSTAAAAAAATGGSLSKVRRFHLSDDIVAASGQEISSYRQALSVDTKVALDASMTGQQDPSPTDIFSFPTPPTPIKAKARPKNHSNYYNTIRRQEPITPSLVRRGNIVGIVDAKTPHPGRRGEARRSLQRQQKQQQHYSSQPQANSSSFSSSSLSRFTNDFDVIGELGKGSFGYVYKVLSRLDGCMYAIKAAQRQAKSVADRDHMLKEVYALAALSDQADTATFHIVRYHQAWMEDDRLYIQTELCSGTLAGEIAVGPLAEPRRFKVLREMLLALDFIHRQHMVHLDIKPENIFLKNDQYKLGDFGLVTRASCDQDVEEGDSRYMSMELLSGDRSDLTKSDIFSLGATLYEICLHRPLPMNGPEWQDIRSGRLMHPLPNTSADLALIISQIMNPVASSRPTAGELLQHPQLLSDEQKALNAEKSLVMALQLAQAQQRFPPSNTMPVRRGLMRSNTWNGTVNSYL